MHPDSSIVWRVFAVIAIALMIASIVLDIVWCVPRPRPGHARWCERPPAVFMPPPD